ncbi:flagellar type III secretion system protein FlhB [Paracoccus luteus]|uniref:flagellar type III secretion system protein FlhB n=1 Tax=Paracoccus luteus TaxID=2508543 RepID=UPI0010700A53|nr:flagellar type III secretion system protein FlhB [Paracoccus luteus]
MSEDRDDRQHEASEQKLRRAREKGDIPRSAEVNTALSWLGVTLGLMLGVPLLLPGWAAMGARLLGAEPWPADAGAAALALSGLAARAVLALAAVPAVLVLVGLVMQRGLVFTPSKLAPDLKRINPITNFGQKFGGKALLTFLMSVAKVTAVSVGGWLLFGRLWGRIMQSTDGDPRAWIAAVPVLLRQALFLALAVAAVFAAVDVFWKWLDFRRRNRMTRKEVEDEYKESEGDPHLRAARRQRAVDLAMSSMLADVEKADVVIVNPTHYAVALEWKRGSGRAPVCLAKGVDEVAARIRDRARSHKVAIWSDPPCARALHAKARIGDEIPRDQFGPVAAAIRFAEAMRAKARQGWGGAHEGGTGR